MADLFIRVPADDTGKRVDTEEITVNSLLVQRQRIQLAGVVDTDIAPCTAADGLSVNLAGNNDVILASEHLRNDVFVESVAIGGELDDTTPVVATEGNVSPARITAQRGIHVNLRDNAGAELGTTGNPVIITDDGAAILVDGSGVTQPISHSTLAVTGGGVESGALRVTIANDSTGIMTIDGTVTANAGTGTLLVDLAGNNDVTATGNVADDAADSGNPVKQGFKAVEMGAAPPAVDADDDRTDAIATPQGIQWVLGGHPNIITREYSTTAVQTGDVIVASVDAGSHIVVTMCSAILDVDVSVTVKCRVGFGTDGAVPTEPTTGNTVDAMVLVHGGIAAGSGLILGNGAAAIAVGGDGQELGVACDVPTGGDLKVLVSYYVSTL